MLVAQKVNDLITGLCGEAICDRCIYDQMNFASHAHSAQITGALGTTSDFIREKSTCGKCGEVRTAISFARGL